MGWWWHFSGCCVYQFFFSAKEKGSNKYGPKELWFGGEDCGGDLDVSPESHRVPIAPSWIRIWNLGMYRKEAERALFSLLGVYEAKGSPGPARVASPPSKRYKNERVKHALSSVWDKVRRIQTINVIYGQKHFEYKWSNQWPLWLAFISHFIEIT